MKFLLTGCGVIGARRVENLPPGAQLIGCFDPDAAKASALAQKYNAKACASLRELLDMPAEAVIVAGINSVLVDATQEALNAGKHVLVEKPAARSLAELQTLRVPQGAVVKVGFNHRFHPAYRAIQAAMSPDDPIMYIRARYGNGARVGFDKEWRSTVELSGGGELLDQGVHVIDLACGLLPELEVVTGYCRTHYWQMPVDDNAWAILATAAGQTFSMHVSSSEWKNEFVFDVYTRRRRFSWVGLGRSYGPETLTTHTMKPEMGPPVSETRVFEGGDESWRLEIESFVSSIRGAAVDGGFADAQRALKHVGQIYLASSKLPHTKPHPHWQP